jgi:predicted nucleic acid-binding protein
VDVIISGDKDLLTLKAFEGIPVIDAAEALKRLGLS